MTAIWQTNVVLLTLVAVMAAAVSYAEAAGYTSGAPAEAAASVRAHVAAGGGRLLDVVEADSGDWIVAAEVAPERHAAIMAQLAGVEGISLEVSTSPSDGPYVRAGYTVRPSPSGSFTWHAPLSRMSFSGVVFKLALATLSAIVAWHISKRRGAAHPVSTAGTT